MIVLVLCHILVESSSVVVVVYTTKNGKRENENEKKKKGVGDKRCLFSCPTLLVT